MWICLNDAFLSIVSKDCGPDELLVRARVREHIWAVFPYAKISESTHTDYRYRAVVSRANVSAALAMQVYSLDYPNFKDSVREPSLRNAYSRVWDVMARLQPTPPYSRLRFQPGPHAIY